MLKIENSIWEKGYEKIACIDEVGRGCLAGDVVACAIIMPKGLMINKVDDSKKLTSKTREKLYDIIKHKAIAIGVGSVDCKTIDKLNIKRSTFLAMEKAISNLRDKNNKKVEPDFLLIDAEKLKIDIPQKSIIKGDLKCHGIAAASIVAKVYRDRKCLDWDKKHKGYNLKKNKGYGTKEHREAIKNIGPSSIHRMTFLRNIVSKEEQLNFLEDKNEY